MAVQKSIFILAQLILALNVAIRSVVAGPTNASFRQCDYDSSTAYEMLLFSAASYCSASSVQAWTCEACHMLPGVRDVYVVESTAESSFGYVAVQPSKNRIVLAFRGTVPSHLQSWIADLEYRRTPWPTDDPQHTNTSQVHHGFLGYYLSLDQQLRTILAQVLLKYEQYQVYITGHSLGGAAATISVVALREIIHQPVLFTFGSPRVGNFDWTVYFAAFPSCVFRVTHDKDMVPHLPPCAYIVHKCHRDNDHPYHVPREVFYDAAFREYKLCNAADGEDTSCADMFSFPTSIDEHVHYFGLHVGEVCVSPPPVSALALRA